MIFQIYNQVDLEPVAKEILKLSKSRNPILFVGNLGSGKTTLINCICKLLEVKDKISSPTFSIINEYHNKHDRIYHMDLYRLKSIDEVFSIGLFDILEQKNYCFIEWPEIIEDYIDGEVLWVKIVLNDDFSRTIEIIH